MAVRGTEERMKERRHSSADLDASIRSGLEEAMAKYEPKEDDDDGEGGSGGEQEGGLLRRSGRGREPEQEEHAGESAGAEAELGGEEEEGSVDEDAGSVSETPRKVEEPSEEESDDERIDEEPAGDEEETLLAGELEPPDFWPANIKTEFKKMPRASQEFYMNSYKGMQADYTNKMQGIAEIHRAIDPVREDLAKTGVSEGEMIRRFVAVHKRLEEDPRAAIRWIASLYGVPVDVARDASAEEEPPPKVKELESRLSHQEMVAAVERAKSVNIEIEQLKASGKMPLYADAEPVMMRIVQQLRHFGQPVPGIVELYEQAVWNTPALRERHLAQSRGAVEKSKLEETKKDVAKSKRAAGKTTGGTAEPAGKKRRPLTLHEELSKRYDEAMRKRG